MPTSTIDPLSKLLLEAAFMAALQGVQSIANHHKDNQKVQDACTNAGQMLNGALSSLMAL